MPDSSKYRESSERLEKSKNQLIYVCILHLSFVSFFVQPESSVFGFSVSNVDDLRLEVLTLIVATFLFINFGLRAMREFSEVVFFDFEDIRKDVTLVEEGNRTAVDQLAESLDTLRQALSNISKIDVSKIGPEVLGVVIEYAQAKALINNKELVAQLIAEGKEDDISMRSYQRRIDDFYLQYGHLIDPAEMEINSFKNNLKDLEATVIRVESSFDKLDGAIDRFNKSQRKVRTSGLVNIVLSISDARLIIFDILLPSLLFILCVSIYLFQGARDFFLNFHELV